MCQTGVRTFDLSQVLLGDGNEGVISRLESRKLSAKWCILYMFLSVCVCDCEFVRERVNVLVCV